MDRRAFLRLSSTGALAGALGMPALLSACAPGTPLAKPATVAGGPAAAGGPYPTYVPFSGPARPDYHLDDSNYSDGYENYLTNPFKSVQDPPGGGGRVTLTQPLYLPPATPYESNPTWQYINKAMNADIRMNLMSSVDYPTHFATQVAGDDLPDIIHIYQGYKLAPNLPAFFKAKCADLTPYLGGDAARDYPYLAAIPTYAWKNSLCAIDGALYLVPIQRHLPTFTSQGGGYFIANADVWDREIGAEYVPKDADDFKKILVQLNRPRNGQSAYGAFGRGDFLFGLQHFTAVFGGPNNWRLDGAGKLLRDRETEEYRAAVGYVRDMMSGGLFPPDAATTVQSRPLHAAGQFVVSVDGYGNAWADLWRRGLDYKNHMSRMIKPFPASAGGKSQAIMGGGYISMNALKKAPPERIKELLRIMNYLAAPFGSQEDLLLSYGLKDQDYTLDDRGNPLPTPDGLARSQFVPWQYIARRPHVDYQADLPGFVKTSFEAQQFLIPAAVYDPTLGYYAPTAYTKGAIADATFYDAVRDILLLRRPLSDLDGAVKDWQSSAGNQVRKEYLEAMAAAK